MRSGGDMRDLTVRQSLDHRETPGPHLGRIERGQGAMFAFSIRVGGILTDRFVRRHSEWDQREGILSAQAGLGPCARSFRRTSCSRVSRGTAVAPLECGTGIGQALLWAGLSDRKRGLSPISACSILVLIRHRGTTGVSASLS